MDHQQLADICKQISDLRIPSNAIVAATFGLPTARARVQRLFIKAYKQSGLPLDQPPDVFLDASLTTPGLNDPSHVWFLSWVGSNLHFTDPFFLDVVTTMPINQLYHLVDIITPRPDLIIPSHLWGPYQDKPNRQELELDRTTMLPTYLRSADGVLGVSLTANKEQLADIPATPTGWDAQTVFVRLHLHGHAHRETQIRLRNGLEPNVSVQHLARLLVKTTRTLIVEAAKANGELHSIPDAESVFIPEKGYVLVNDITLLGFVHISPGKVTPLISLRG